MGQMWVMYCLRSWKRNIRGALKYIRGFLTKHVAAKGETTNYRVSHVARKLLRS
jgi:hypothetical protein